MRTLKGAAIALCMAVLCAVISPGARGDTWDKKTIVTFSGDVQVPGQVLPAGTYVFKLANFSSDRHIVQIWNEDETSLVTTVIAIPSQRTEPADKAIFELDGQSSEGPAAVKKWFYPGNVIGLEFTYSNAPHSYPQ